MTGQLADLPSFRRIAGIPFDACMAALESWQLTGHDGELRLGNSLLRGPIERDQRSRRGLTSKVHLLADSGCRPLAPPDQRRAAPRFRRLPLPDGRLTVARRGPGRPRTRPAAPARWTHASNEHGRRHRVVCLNDRRHGRVGIDRRERGQQAGRKRRGRHADGRRSRDGDLRPPPEGRDPGRRAVDPREAKWRGKSARISCGKAPGGPE
jgi:hypothetical protein